MLTMLFFYFFKMTSQLTAAVLNNNYLIINCFKSLKVSKKLLLNKDDPSISLFHTIKKASHRWMAHLFHLTIFLFTEHHCHIQGIQHVFVNILPDRAYRLPHRYLIFSYLHGILALLRSFLC